MQASNAIREDQLHDVHTVIVKPKPFGHIHWHTCDDCLLLQAWVRWSWILNFEFRFFVTFLPHCDYVVTSQLYLMEEIGVHGENHRQTPSRWKHSNMPQGGFKLRQWWEIASSQWQRLRPLGHPGRPTMMLTSTVTTHSSSQLLVWVPYRHIIPTMPL